jgi:hypothetical protein
MELFFVQKGADPAFAGLALSGLYIGFDRMPHGLIQARIFGQKCFGQRNGVTAVMCD